jgi:hypothetical protein
MARKLESTFAKAFLKGVSELRRDRYQTLPALGAGASPLPDLPAGASILF